MRVTRKRSTDIATIPKIKSCKDRLTLKTLAKKAEKLAEEKPIPAVGSKSIKEFKGIRKVQVECEP